MLTETLYELLRHNPRRYMSIKGILHVFNQPSGVEYQNTPIFENLSTKLENTVKLNLHMTVVRERGR